jgi:Tfp pilus assembly protein PilP
MIASCRYALAFVLAASMASAAAAQAPAPAKPPATAPAPAAKPTTPAAAQPAKPATTPAPAQPAKPATPAPAQPAKPAPAATPPAAPTTAPPAAAPPPSAAATPPAQEAYTYRADGRRDPFLNLVGTGSTEGKLTSRKGEGPSGLSLGEISVRGIMQSRGALVAMIQGPDNKTFLVHSGDKLLDGTIKSITPQGLVVVQEVNDPLSLIKQREVRKLLRSLEDAKE